MHMADALISPAVGGVMWAAAAGAAGLSIKKMQKDVDNKIVPLMGVAGAFVFAAQMINFSIPGTGSSGHIGGGMLLAALLGPYAGFLTMAAVLLVQALFFADGGLLAYGCNVFNLGFYTCFIAYPFIYKKFMRKGINSENIFSASIISVIIALQMGSFSVVLQTLISGKTELPFVTFTLLMQPIHLAIGAVEGLITATVLSFIWRVRPELIQNAYIGRSLGSISIKKVLTYAAVITMFVGVIFSWFASADPDGLEWSMLNAAGTPELNMPDGIHKTLSEIQKKTAFLPDYGFKENENVNIESSEDNKVQKKWPAVDPGTSLSGFVGAVMTLVLAAFTGFGIIIIKRRKKLSTAKD